MEDREDQTLLLVAGPVANIVMALLLLLNVVLYAFTLENQAQNPMWFPIVLVVSGLAITFDVLAFIGQVTSTPEQAAAKRWFRWLMISAGLSAVAVVGCIAM